MMSDKRRTVDPKKRRELGQGLVEFALVLPALLLTLMGIADFGRLFAVYSNLFNAAREGTRYGVVSPRDVGGIFATVRGHITMVDPNDANISVRFDGGPGTPNKNYDEVIVGDRVIVALNADVELITPFIRAITQRLRVETTATRTISSVGELVSSDSPAPPTATPDNTTTPSPTPLGADTATPPSGDTGEPVFTPTPTFVVVPSEAPIIIDIPLWDGDVMVTGTAQPGETVHLRDIQDPTLDLSTVVQADGSFQFLLSGSLIAGHVVAVQGYGQIDYAIVEGNVLPTDTPTPTATPTLTPTPNKEYIDVSPTCGPAGNTLITVSGHQWPTNKGYLAILWDGVEVEQVDPPSADFNMLITVSADAGVHTVTVQTTDLGVVYSDAKSFEVPCPIIPTPTPSQPNLVVEGIALENSGTLSTYDPLTFTVGVRNIGAAAANSLFWVDLYTDPALEPPTPSDLSSGASVAWAAVSSLPENQAISLTVLYPEGFVTTGDHRAYALADSWDQVLESDELDNVGGPLTVTVALDGVPPSPTPTPTPGGVANGAISGSTWLFISGDIVPQGRVNVYCYAGAELIAETLSDQDGNYVLPDITPGTYSVIGQTYINDVYFSDVVLNVQVSSGSTTRYITMILH
jgi:Flp pilus assembly protein TadG